MQNQMTELEELTPLSIDEQNAITGGGLWDDIKDGVKDGYRKVEGGVKQFGRGLKDGAAESPSRSDDLWYNLGYGGPRLIPG